MYLIQSLCESGHFLKVKLYFKKLLKLMRPACFAIVYGFHPVGHGKTYAEDGWERRSQVHMGTFVSVKLLASVSSEHFTRAFNNWSYLDTQLSSFKQGSQIYELNRHKRRVVSKLVISILKRAFEVGKLTDGAFDVTVGSYTKGVYRFGEQGAVVEAYEKALNKVRPHVDWRKVIVEGMEVRLEPQMQIDLGGIGKGFGVQYVADDLRSHKITKGVVAASGDILCLSECNIIIQDPSSNGGLLGFGTKGENMSISTSGPYERRISGSKIHHLIEPRTGRPAQTFSSVTLITRNDSALVDALATGVGVLSSSKALKLLNKMPKIGYFLLGMNGDIWTNSNFLKWTKARQWLKPKSQFRIHKEGLTHL